MGVFRILPLLQIKIQIELRKDIFRFVWQNEYRHIPWQIQDVSILLDIAFAKYDLILKLPVFYGEHSIHRRVLSIVFS